MKNFSSSSTSRTTSVYTHRLILILSAIIVFAGFGVASAPTPVAQKNIIGDGQSMKAAIKEGGTLRPASALVTKTSNVTPSGTWNDPNDWSPVGVPVLGDDVIIAAGDTIVVDVNTASIASLTVSGTLTVGNSNTDRIVTVTGDITVDIGATFTSAGDGDNELIIGGDLTNNGTFTDNSGDMDVTFNGTANQTVSGTGATTDFNEIVINNTGAANDNFVEIASTNFTAATSFLENYNSAGTSGLLAGILKMSGTYTLTNLFFPSTTYTINADEGIWVNNPNVTVTAQSSDANINGLLRVSAGTYNVGSGSDDDLIYDTGSTLTIEGGALNIGGALHGSLVTSTTTYSQSGGTVTIVTQDSNSGTFGSFDIRAAGSSFTMSAGTIVLQEATATVDDVQVNATTNNVTGGTLQVGNASSPGGQVVVINSSTPVFNVTVFNTTGSATLRLDASLTVKGSVSIQTSAILNANAFNMNVAGNWTNSGTFTPSTGTVTFDGAANQSISGTTTPSLFNNLTVNNTGALGTNIVSLDVNTTVGAALTIDEGILRQAGASNLIVTGATTINAGGNLNIFSTGTGNFTGAAVTVNLGGGWEFFGGTGGDPVVVTLSGTVTNSGNVRFDGGTQACGEADTIQIRSSAAGTPRSWNGTGTFSMQDVNVQDQAGTAAITVVSGTDNGGNGANWVFVALCVPTSIPANIAGHVIDNNGAPLPGVTMTLLDTILVESRTTVTDVSGFYQFNAILTGRDILVTPSRNGYTFSPQNRLFNHTGELTNVDFTGTPDGTVRSIGSDFDGDGRADLSVFRPSDATWYTLLSSTNTLKAEQWGLGTDRIAPADYDGDHVTDLAVFRPSDGGWYIKQSSTSTLRAVNWGLADDVITPADFDGDGQADIAVWRPATGTWYIIQSTNGQVRSENWGTNGDRPVAADYDGDGKADLAVWRPTNGTWYVLKSTNGSFQYEHWGIEEDRPVVGDYDGDRKSDLAVFRPSTATWYVKLSSDQSTNARGHGTAVDVLVPGDYDGDGKTDRAVWQLGGDWNILRSTTNTPFGQMWGTTGDIPTTSAYVR